MPIVEVTVTPEIKSGEESGVVPETAVKSKKKSKKKSAIKSAEPEVPVATETMIETQEETQPAPVVELKVAPSKQSEIKEEGKTSIMKWSIVYSIQYTEINYVDTDSVQIGMRTNNVPCAVTCNGLSDE